MKAGSGQMMLITWVTMAAYIGLLLVSRVVVQKMKISAGKMLLGKYAE